MGCSCEPSGLMSGNSNPQTPFPEDMEFQRRGWIVERTGWAMMAAVTHLGLLGVFSKSPLSETEITTPDGTLRVEYERFARRTARSHFTIRAMSLPPGEVLVRIGPQLVQSFDIEAIQPE